MSTTHPAGCRIGKVRPKNGSAEITILNTPKHDETGFVPTLVAMLERARSGRLLGYSMVFRYEEDDGTVCEMEASMTDEDGNPHKLLGLMRRAEHNYIKRTWDESEDIPLGAG